MDHDDEVDARYQLAYDLAVSGISEQRVALDELRSRVGVVLSGASVATGFLASQSLRPGRGFPAPAWLAVAAAFGLVAVCAFVLAARGWDGLGVDPSAVIADAEGRPDRPMSEYYGHLAANLTPKIVHNRKQMKTLYRYFNLALLLLVVDFGGWIWTLGSSHS